MKLLTSIQLPSSRNLAVKSFRGSQADREPNIKELLTAKPRATGHEGKVAEKHDEKLARGL